MTSPWRAGLDLLLRLTLALGLVFSPLAQPLAMASLATPQPASAGGCPHHAKSAQMQAAPEQPKPGECCFKKGSACHCAMAVALPTTTRALPVASGSDHPDSAPRLACSLLPTPEPPPPRS